MPYPDFKKCLQVMKTLEKDNERLKNEKNSYKKETESLKVVIGNLEKRQNELKTQIALNDSYTPLQPTISSQNTTIDQLTAQNLVLQNELQQSQTVGKVQDILTKSDLEQKLVEYESVISHNKKEIAYLKQNNTNSVLAEKLADLQQLFNKTKAVNQSYAREISSLQEQLNAFTVPDIKETQAQAASGDQDLTPAGSSYANATESLKEECVNENSLKLPTNFQDQKTLIDELKMERDELLAKTLKLEEENDYLKAKCRLLSSAKEFPLDTQMKFFLDDFYDERKEKEKQVQENLEIKGENSRLKEQLGNLVQLLNNTGNSTVQTQQTQYQQQRSMNEQPAQFERNLSSQEETSYFPSAPFTTPTQAKQNFSGFENNGFKPSLHQQYSNPMQPTYREPLNENSQKRIIGFTSPARFSPTSPPFHSLPPFSQTTPQLSMRQPITSQHMHRQVQPISYNYHILHQADSMQSIEQHQINPEKIQTEKQLK